MNLFYRKSIHMKENVKLLTAQKLIQIMSLFFLVQLNH